jgi:hypothetical protein
MNEITFQLRFPISEIREWASRYPAEYDDEILAAGGRIRSGECSREILEKIVMWKSARRVKLIQANTDNEIEEALCVAAKARGPRVAIGVLMGLCGVGLPMASAILTAINPDDYTIIDFRAMEALGVADFSSDRNFYLLKYLPECKRLANEACTSLRMIDRALWSWSKHNVVKGTP